MQTDTKPRQMRRADAADYLSRVHGLPISKSWLNKAAVKGGGPPMVYFGATPLYNRDALDEWARAALSAPVTSTAGRKVQAA